MDRPTPAATLRLRAPRLGTGEDQLLLELAAAARSGRARAGLPGRWLATGAGERLEPLPPPNPPFGVLVLPIADSSPLPPSMDTPTGWELPAAAQDLERHRAATARRPRPRRPDPARHSYWLNDLQTAAAELCPAIEEGLAAVDRPVRT